MLSILLFGAPELRLDGQPLPLLRRKTRALLYYLATHGEPVRRERLLLLLWPDLDRPAAQHSLRTLLHGLRQTLGPTLLVTDETLALAPDTEVDVRRLAAALAQPPGELHSLEAALTLYRGEFLADFSLPDSPGFDDWVVAERERYRQFAIHGLTMLAQLQTARRAWSAALAAITRAVDLDPLREDVQSVAMQLQYFAGDRTGAIRRYEQLRKLLDDELGLPPMAETRAVYDAIITERLQPAIVPPPPAEPDLARPTPPHDDAPSPKALAPPESVAAVAPILATKLFLPPARVELVPRPRLRARLDRGLAGPLTIIAAPAGFGKTTLLADWLAQQSQGMRPPAFQAPPRQTYVAWLSLDAGDSDPIQFLRYVIAALQTVAPVASAQVLSVLNRAQSPRIEPLLPLLVNDLAALPDPTILVLDDYHVVEAPAVHQALAFLLDHLPPQLHLVLATRSDPPLPLARLRARRQLTELRAQDLRFTYEEAGQFFREVMGIALSAADVAALETRTEGWIAGLQLAALSLQDRPREQMAPFIEAFTGSHRFVVDYLVDEVLARQPAHLQTFLLRTSILERLAGALCDAVMVADADERAGTADPGQPLSSQAVLEHLERGNLFIVPLDDERRWYRYHHLFAQVLRERLQGSVGPDVVASLHRRAAAWFERQGLVVEAVQHALMAHDWERAADMIEAHGLELLTQGHVNTVLRWIDAIPASQSSVHPYLNNVKAVALFHLNQLEAAERHLQVAEAYLSSDLEDDRSRLILGHATNLRASIAQFRGDYAGQLTLTRRSLEISPEADVYGRSISMMHLACAFRLTGDVAEANEELLRHVARTHTAGDLITHVYIIANLAELQRRQGRLRQAAATYRSVEQLVPDGSVLRTFINAAAFYFGLGDVLREQNDLDQAEVLLREGWDIVRSGQITEAEVIINGYTALAQLRFMRGDSHGVTAILTELGDIARRRSFAPDLHARIAAVSSHLALLRGDLQAVEQWANSSDLRADDEVTYIREIEYLTLVRVRIAQARHDPRSTRHHHTLSLLDRLVAAAEANSRTDTVIQILILRALALHVAGDLAAALPTLGRALALAAPEGYIRVFLDEGLSMATLLAQGAETWGMADGGRRTAPGTPPAHVRQYAEQLLEAFRTEAVVPQHGLDPASPPPDPPSDSSHVLTERELEVLRLLAAGHSNRAIAEKLIVAVGTVKRHVSNIMDKLQAESRLEVVARARDLGLI